MTRDDDDQRCKDQTAGEIRYRTSDYVDDQVPGDQNGQGARTRPKGKRIHEHICCWFWIQRKILKAINVLQLHENTGNDNIRE